MSLKEFLTLKVIAPLASALPRNVKLHLVATALRAEADETAVLSRETLAAAYLRGDGIEIGALNHPLKVPPSARVTYVDRDTAETLRRAYPDLEVRGPDVIDDGESLATFADSSLDFVIANHFIEHAEDPIKTVGNFFRVLKTGGILFLAIPDKRFTFDFNRPVTTFDHLLRDHEEGPEVSRAAHFEEIRRLVLKGSADRMDEVGHNHFHVWNQAAMLDMIVRLKGTLDFEVLCYLDHLEWGEGIFILRKGEVENVGMAERSLEFFHNTYGRKVGS